jgi:hypothetical protein
LYVPIQALSASDGIGQATPDTEASCLHEKHSILLFFLGKRSLLVLRFASCEAISEEVRLSRTPKRA